MYINQKAKNSGACVVLTGSHSFNSVMLTQESALFSIGAEIGQSEDPLHYALLAGSSNLRVQARV